MDETEPQAATPSAESAGRQPGGTVLEQLTEQMTTDRRLMIWLAAQKRRQNYLVQCPAGRFEGIGAHVMAFSAPPVRLCRIPGPLCLPPERTGTLVIDDVAGLRLDQQITLFDWLGSGGGDVRVISVTAAPLGALVESGAFLEGLFHRLSTVQLALTPEGQQW
jgi:hypothetical protein